MSPLTKGVPRQSLSGVPKGTPNPTGKELVSFRDTSLSDVFRTVLSMRTKEKFLCLSFRSTLLRTDETGNRRVGE